MSKKRATKQKKSKSSEPQNQPSSPSPKSSSQQLVKLRLLIEERLNNERVNRGELVAKLSAKFQSTNDFIKFIMLIMLFAEVVPEIRRQPLDLIAFNTLGFVAKVRIEKAGIKVVYDQNTTFLLTDTHLINKLLADDELINIIFEHIDIFVEYIVKDTYDPIELDEKLIDIVLESPGRHPLARSMPEIELYRKLISHRLESLPPHRFRKK